jgi:hypothetical protein
MLPSAVDLAAPDPTKGPTAPAPGVAESAPTPGVKTLNVEQVNVWRNRITAALEASLPAITSGKTNVSRYLGKYLNTAPNADECLVPTDFYYVESKKAQLFYRLPDVYVKPEQPGLEDAAVVFQAALNKELGPAGVNVLPTVQQVIFDLLCPTGFGAVALGYQTIIGDPPTVPVPMGVGPDGLPRTQPGPNITAAWYFLEHVRPGDLIVDASFSGLDFDKSPFVGQRFREDVPEEGDASGSAENDERRLMPLPSGAQAAARKQRTGYEIWYRAHLFDADVKHPDKIRTFKVYDDDRETPVEVRDHPHQRYANPAGKLKEGMRGYPIVPMTLRYVSDTWMPPSDCTMARNTADELSRGRTQMLRSRDRNLPQWGFDATRVDTDVQSKIEQGTLQGGIPFNGPGQDATWPISKGDGPRETYQFNEVAQGDLQRIWRMGSNQIGVMDDKSRTASEAQITQNASQEAHEADRAVVMAWYVRVVSKYASLLQLYATEEQFVELVGADAQRLKKQPPAPQAPPAPAGPAAPGAVQDARALVPWNKDLIQGLFAFSVKPNSQVYVDAAQEKKQLMDLYQFFVNDPTVNRAELTRAIITRYGFDPSKVMQQAPPKDNPTPSVSLSIKAESDFNPMNPQSPIVLEAMSKMGIPIDMAAVQAGQQLAGQQIQAQQMAAAAEHGAEAQTAHGGAAAKAEPLSKHAAVATGGMQGTGQPAPLGAGGQQ